MMRKVKWEIGPPREKLSSERIYIYVPSPFQLTPSIYFNSPQKDAFQEQHMPLFFPFLCHPNISKHHVVTAFFKNRKGITTSPITVCALENKELHQNTSMQIYGVSWGKCSGSKLCCTLSEKSRNDTLQCT
jgi:hypothetical protein